MSVSLFFFNDTATTEIYTLSLHDALPILQSDTAQQLYHGFAKEMPIIDYHCHLPPAQIASDHQFENITQAWLYGRSEEHTSELQSRQYLVCRLLLEKKKKI